MNVPPYIDCKRCRSFGKTFGGKAVAVIDNEGTAHLRSIISDITFCTKKATYMPRFRDFHPEAVKEFEGK